MKHIIFTAAVALLAAPAAFAEQPTDPNGYGQARAAGAKSDPGFVGGAISARASAFKGDGTSEGDKSQADLSQYSGNDNGVRSDE